MTYREIIKKLLFPDFSIGDLVRLNEDSDLKIGFGIIEDLKLNFDDIYDINYLLDRIEEHKMGIKISEENEGFFSTKPQALVMWTGKRLAKSNSMWMYTSEITVVHKVINSGRE